MSTSSAIDLSDIAIVDNHAHALAHRQPDDAATFRENFSEAHDPSLARDHVGSSVQYRWALRQITALLNLPPDEDTFLAHRRAVDFPAYARWLVQDAGLSWLLLDEGYPSPELAYSSSEMENMLGVRIGRILRIETVLEGMMAQSTTLGHLESHFDAALDHARNAGVVALKSIAAYRTGLKIEPVREWDVMRAFADVRRGLGSPFRLASKPLIDHFVFRALRFAAQHSMPMQFHTGYGDPDLDLRLANPLHLRALFEERAFATAPIVLLHESFPFTAEASFLAAAYPNAYVDVAFSLPPLDRGLLCGALRTVLGTAPVSKVLCSSDGTLIPEHYWLGAMRARLCFSEVLGEMVDADELDTAEAVSFARMALHDNAVRIYHLYGDSAEATPQSPVTLLPHATNLEERMPTESPADRLARALDSTAKLVSGIRDDQWSNDTPCPEWDVQTLVNHLVSGNRMFAGIVRGEPSPPRSELGRLQDSDQLGDDPTRSFNQTAAALVAAFDHPGVLERAYVAPIGTVAGEVLFHLRLTEALVHGWDLAHATDQPAALPSDLAEEALAFSSGPTAPDVPRTGHPFGPIRAMADDAPAIDRLAAYLGRPVPRKLEESERA